MSRIIFRESAAPTTPASGQMTLFADTNGDLSWLDDGGNLTKLVTTGATTITLPNATDTIAVLGTQQTFTARPIFSTTIGVGSATPSTSGSGITFPATQSPSTDANTLDDYEEGTYTPTLIGNGTAGNPVYSTQTGRYTKIGNVVFVQAIVFVTSNTTGTGTARISLPTAVGNAANAASFFTWTASVDWPSGSNAFFQAVAGQAFADLYAYGDNINTAVVTDLVGAYEINGFYFV